MGLDALGALGADQRDLLSALNLPQLPDETISAGGYTVVKIPGAEPRWEVLIQSPATPLKVPTPQDPAVWEAHNILCGLPTLKAATSGQFTTHKLGLIRLNAVSLNKGCYLGQEIVARTQYLGTQKGGLYWASVEPPHTCTPNTEILNTQQQLIGHVIESSTIDNHFTLILAALKQTPHQDDTYFIAKTPTSLSIPFTDEFA
jgi:folate-binding protein YgfZ